MQHEFELQVDRSWRFQGDRDAGLLNSAPRDSILHTGAQPASRSLEAADSIAAGLVPLLESTSMDLANPERRNLCVLGKGDSGERPDSKANQTAVCLPMYSVAVFCSIANKSWGGSRDSARTGTQEKEEPSKIQKQPSSSTKLIIIITIILFSFLLKLVGALARFWLFSNTTTFFFIQHQHLARPLAANEAR